MIVYIIILLFVLLMESLLYCKKITSKTFLRVVFSVLALVLGLRGKNVGEDTAHYIAVFEKVNTLSWKSILTSGTDVVYETIWNVDRSMEVGYTILNKFVRMFTSNAQWVLIIVAFATCYLMAKFIRDNCQNVFIPTYVFLCESLYMQSFNLMRQMLAIAIGLQAYTVLKKGKGKSYIHAAIIILLAFLFHKSAITLFLLLPLWRCKNNRIAMKYTLIGSALAPFGFSIINRVIVLIIPRYAGYIINNYWESNIGGVAILWVIEIFMVLFVFSKYRNEDGKEPFIATTCTALYIALEIVGLKLTIFTRITLYFRAFLMFMFPYFGKYIKPNSRILYKGALIVLLSVLYLRYASVPARMYYFFWM